MFQPWCAKRTAQWVFNLKQVTRRTQVVFISNRQYKALSNIDQVNPIKYRMVRSDLAKIYLRHQEWDDYILIIPQNIICRNVGKFPCAVHFRYYLCVYCGSLRGLSLFTVMSSNDWIFHLEWKAVWWCYCLHCLHIIEPLEKCWEKKQQQGQGRNRATSILRLRWHAQNEGVVSTLTLMISDGASLKSRTLIVNQINIVVGTIRFDTCMYSSSSLYKEHI